MNNTNVFATANLPLDNTINAYGSYVGDYFINVIPLEATDMMAVRGYAYIEDRFKIQVLKRLNTDRRADLINNMIEDPKSLMVLSENIRKAIIYNFLRDKLIVPIFPMKIDAVNNIDYKSQGFAYDELQFKMTYCLDDDYMPSGFCPVSNSSSSRSSSSRSMSSSSSSSYSSSSENDWFGFVD